MRKTYCGQPLFLLVRLTIFTVPIMLDFIASFFGHVFYEVIWVNIVFSFVKKTNWGKDFTAMGLWWTVFVSTILFIVILACSLLFLKKFSFSSTPIALLITFLIWTPVAIIVSKYLRKVGK